jgi:hypothetical protein
MPSISDYLVIFGRKMPVSDHGIIAITFTVWQKHALAKKYYLIKGVKKIHFLNIQDISDVPEFQKWIF